MAELPPVCVTVAGRTPHELLKHASLAAGVAAKGASLDAAGSCRFVELRLDYLENPKRSGEVIRQLHRLHVPCIATLRSAAAGGNFGGSAEEQLHILQQSAEAGATLIDLEIEAAEHLGAEAVKGLRKRAKLLLSFHDYRETPEDPSSALDRLKAYPADYYKVVTRAHRHRDNAAVLDLLSKGRGHLVANTLGEIGHPTRVLCLAGGAPFTYAAPSEGGVPGLGQLPASQLCGLYRAGKISSRTRRYGVVGNPIGHSLSPVIHNAAFAALNLNAVFLPFGVEEFEDFVAARSGYRLNGFSVTMPHKEAAAAAADRLDSLATTVGAVNTIVARRGGWHGYNTDVAGILKPLKKRRVALRGARVLVAGAGGAARAAAFALAGAGAEVAIVARRHEQAAALARQVGGQTMERHDLAEEAFDVILHATPLGLAPDVEGCFFRSDQLNAPLVFETIYNPLETRLVKMARRRGLQVILGLEMFLEQAAAQFKLWTGRKAPLDVMEKAARAALRK